MYIDRYTTLRVKRALRGQCKICGRVQWFSKRYLNPRKWHFKKWWFVDKCLCPACKRDTQPQENAGWVYQPVPLFDLNDAGQEPAGVLHIEEAFFRNLYDDEDEPEDEDDVEYTGN